MTVLLKPLTVLLKPLTVLLKPLFLIGDLPLVESHQALSLPFSEIVSTLLSGSQSVLLLSQIEAHCINPSHVCLEVRLACLEVRLTCPDACLACLEVRLASLDACLASLDACPEACQLLADWWKLCLRGADPRFDLLQHRVRPFEGLLLVSNVFLCCFDDSSHFPDSPPPR